MEHFCLIGGDSKQPEDKIITNSGKEAAHKSAYTYYPEHKHSCPLWVSTAVLVNFIPND